MMMRAVVLLLAANQLLVAAFTVPSTRARAVGGRRLSSPSAARHALRMATSVRPDDYLQTLGGGGGAAGGDVLGTPAVGPRFRKGVKQVSTLGPASFDPAMIEKCGASASGSRTLVLLCARVGRKGRGWRGPGGVRASSAWRAREIDLRYARFRESARARGSASGEQTHEPPFHFKRESMNRPYRRPPPQALPRGDRRLPTQPLAPRRRADRRRARDPHDRGQVRAPDRHPRRPAGPEAPRRHVRRGIKTHTHTQNKPTTIAETRPRRSAQGDISPRIYARRSRRRRARKAAREKSGRGRLLFWVLLVASHTRRARH